MKIIATDLDRTLIPNGTATDNSSVANFTAMINENKFGLIYVTARNIESVQKAIVRYGLPIPEVIIGQVGSSMHTSINGKYQEVTAWQEHVNVASPHWNYDELIHVLSDISLLEMQDKKEQNQFKLSYTVHSLEHFSTIVPAVKDKIETHFGSDAEVTASRDLNANCVYIDILPSAVSKYKALEFYRLQNNLSIDQFLFAGDSENDLSLLESSYSVVVVKNAHPSVKERVIKNKCGIPPIVASGRFELDGNYGNGIIEAIRILGWSKNL